MTEAQADKHRTIPGPHPLFGPYSAAFSFFNDPIGYLDKLFKGYGNLVWVKTPPMALPPTPSHPGSVFLYGPDLIQRVVMEHDAYYRVAMSLSLYPEDRITERQEPLRRIMTGLPFLRKGEHRRHRRLMMPAFHKQAVQTYHGDMVSATKEMLHDWNPGERIDVSQEMLHLTMRITALTLFGQDAVEQGERLGSIVEDWVDYVMSPSHLLPYDFPGFRYRNWLTLSKEIETATRRLIDEKRAAGASDHSLLSMLINLRDQDGSSLSEDELIGHISLLLWGSRDASVYAAVWTLFLLSQHPDILADLVAELDDALGGDSPQIEQLDQLSLLERSIKESLRLLPPFPVIHRVSAELNTLGDYSIPAGAEVIMSTYHTHRIPEIYPDPLAFNPDRWLGIRPSVFEFTPFSGGQRMCIGASFAMQELKIVLCLVLQSYRLEFIPGTRVDRQVHVTLTPKEGMPVIIRKQDRQFKKGVGGVRGNIRKMVKLPE
jgi:cytochrome P450